MSAGGCRRCAPAALAGITEGGREHRSEPQELREGKAEDDGSDENPRASAVEERDELVRRHAQLRLIAGDDGCDDEQDDEDDAGAAASCVPNHASEDLPSRSVLNAARSSVLKRSGSCQAAKWLPLSSSLK